MVEHLSYLRSARSVYGEELHNLPIHDRITREAKKGGGTDAAKKIGDTWI